MEGTDLQSKNLVSLLYYTEIRSSGTKEESQQTLGPLLYFCFQRREKRNKRISPSTVAYTDTGGSNAPYREKDHSAAKLSGRRDPIFGHRMTPHARYEQGVSGIPSVACLTRADSILENIINYVGQLPLHPYPLFRTFVLSVPIFVFSRFKKILK